MNSSGRTVTGIPATGATARGTDAAYSLPKTAATTGGEFKNDLYHGKGVSVTAEGNRYEGAFKNGELHGHGIVAGKNGKKYKVEFRNGSLISKKRIY